MKKKALLFTFCLFSGILLAQQPEIFEKSDKYGIKEQNRIIVKPKYTKIEVLSPDFYAVQNGERSGVINKNGVSLIPEIYDEIKYYGQNLFLIRLKNRWGLVNRSNKILLPTEYTEIKFVNADVCQIKKDDKVGLISKYGYPILPVLYDKIDQFTENTYVVEIAGKRGILGSLGEALVPVQYDGFNVIPGSYMYSVISGNKVGLMDYSFKIVLETEYDKIEPSALGMTLYKDGKIGFYTESGKIINPSYEQILFVQPEFGLAVVKQGQKLAFVTKSGVETPAVYENISRFSDRGIAFVEKSGKLMAINTSGREMTVQQTMGKPVGPPF